MSFGQNLQFLRKMRHNMTQEELAEKLGVSRQAISKWEMDTAYPEMNNLVELCRLFSCTMDELVQKDMNVSDEAYSDIRVEQVEAFRYISYAVISVEPEEDAIGHVKQWAKQLNMHHPKIIGWDFPEVSQEQINVYHMHGYAAALILNEETAVDDEHMEVCCQEKQKYIAITISFAKTSQSPFQSIPNAYKILMTYMKTNGIRHKRDKKVISCFEKEYTIEGEDYMDVYIAIE